MEIWSRYKHTLPFSPQQALNVEQSTKQKAIEPQFNTLSALLNCTSHRLTITIKKLAQHLSEVRNFV
jgi:hypothetical protein